MQITGKIEEKFLHMNCMGISEDEIFKVGRGMERSDAVQVLDLYENFVFIKLFAEFAEYPGIQNKKN